MNKIDILIIINLITILVIVFFIYKWYKVVAQNHGKMLALLIPISAMAFLSSFNSVNENEAKKISQVEISKTLKYKNNFEELNTNGLKNIRFEHEVSLLQSLHFNYGIAYDSVQKSYNIKNENLSSSGVSSNLEWTDHITNFQKVNDSIYEFEIIANYKSKILFLITDNDNRSFTKRINVNDNN